MKLTLVTPACNRPEAFTLCEKYIAAQTVKPFQWIVIDDDEPATICTMGQQYIRIPKSDRSLTNKVAHLITMDLIKGDAIVFIENDDYYAPTWLEFCDKNLQQYDLIGEGRAVYYNATQRWWYEHHNVEHASLCSTALTRKLFIDLLQACQSQNPFIDSRLWRMSKGKKKVFDPLFHADKKRLVVGIKGMPGRVGYGAGHVIRDVNAKDDLNLEKLRELIGVDAGNYSNLGILKNKASSKTETGKAHGDNWMKWLGHLTGKPEVVGMELGTFRGESAEWFCENILTNSTSKFLCVDTFQGSVEHHIGKIDCSNLEKETRERLKDFPQANIIRGYSHEVLKSFAGLLDFVYVDASHDSFNVLRDSVLAFELLKSGGILIWDDYDWKVMGDEIDCPKPAIDAVLKCYSKQIEVLEPRGWQLAIKKK